MLTVTLACTFKKVTDALLSTADRPSLKALLIVLQGFGLPDKMICIFRNSTFAAAVNATVLSDTEAMCLSPEWPGDDTVEVCCLLLPQLSGRSVGLLLPGLIGLHAAGAC